MRFDQSLSTDRAGVDSPTRAHRPRAQAEQIDFLNGMVILLFGLGLFFVSGSVLFAIGLDSSPDREGAVHNADQRLVEDLLATESGSLSFDGECADAYFGMSEHEGCDISATVFNTTAQSELHWLRHSLGLEDHLHANVTVVDGEFDGESTEFQIVTGEDGTEYAIGPSPPPGMDIAAATRFVVTDDTEYYTVSVRVW